MRVLLVGAAGYVASIVRPELERRYDCRYFDRRPVLGRKSRTIVADVLDGKAVARAVRGADVVVYSALGVPSGDRAKHIGCDDIEAAFRVNVSGWYQFAWLGLQAGVRRFVYVSSLSVYTDPLAPGSSSERVPPTAFYPYGFSKRAGEHVCDGLALACPEATITSLRLMAPLSDERFARAKADNPEFTGVSYGHTGPNDLRRAFIAAIDLVKPGHHVVHISSDARQELYKCGHSKRVLGWGPRGD